MHIAFYTTIPPNCRRKFYHGSLQLMPHAWRTWFLRSQAFNGMVAWLKYLFLCSHRRDKTREITCARSVMELEPILLLQLCWRYPSLHASPEHASDIPLRPWGRCWRRHAQFPCNSCMWLPPQKKGCLQEFSATHGGNGAYPLHRSYRSQVNLHLNPNVKPGSESAKSNTNTECLISHNFCCSDIIRRCTKLHLHHLRAISRKFSDSRAPLSI